MLKALSANHTSSSRLLPSARLLEDGSIDYYGSRSRGAYEARFGADTRRRTVIWELIVAGAAAIKIPTLVEAGVKSVGERLLGPVIDSWALPLKLRAEHRARIAHEIAEAGAQIVKSRPELFRSDIEHLLIQSGARQDNVSAAFAKALEHISTTTEEPQEGALPPPPPSDDWLNRWKRQVEDASSEELQDAFARILAGEIARPGSFSLATLRVVAELTKEIARDFQYLWADVIGDCAVKYPNYGRGDDWLRLLRLREAGLVAQADASIHRPPSEPKNLWGFFGGGSTLIVAVDPISYSEVPIINLSRIGNELGSILPVPNYAANLRRLALECPDRRGWQSATLVVPGKSPDTIWTAPSLP